MVDAVIPKFKIINTRKPSYLNNKFTKKNIPPKTPNINIWFSKRKLKNSIFVGTPHSQTSIEIALFLLFLVLQK